MSSESMIFICYESNSISSYIGIQIKSGEKQTTEQLIHKQMASTKTWFHFFFGFIVLVARDSINGLYPDIVYK